ncbi:MAG: helix-turn-helix transcriptional regulator [Solirubrobacterales bacterium]
MSGKSITRGQLGERERSRLARNVSYLRARKGISREELAFLASLAATRMAQIERGRPTDAGLDAWVRIAGSLGVELSELVAGVSWDPASRRFLIFGDED